MSARNFIVDDASLPDLAGMMLVTVKALKEIGGSAAISELDEKVAEMEGVTETEQSYLMANESGVPRLNYYLAWARTYLKRGGALENSRRGVWALTPDGAAIADLSDTQAIYDQVQQEERERARTKRLARAQKADMPDPECSSQPDLRLAQIETDQESAEASWEEKLLAVLRAMQPAAFERLAQRLLREAGFAQRLLREAGFTKVEVRGKSGDGGIDGVGVLRVNLVSFQVYFQCKRYSGGVSAGEIRDFRGAMQGRADKGLFITTGHYTAQANEEATRDGATAIDLIDGTRLCELLKINGLGVSSVMVEKVHIDSNWFEAI